MKVSDRISVLLRDGQTAARLGQRAQARRRFRAVLTLEPENTTALLWMAWLSDDPRASLAYIVRMLSQNPRNAQARAALRWAQQRLTTAAQIPPASPRAPQRGLWPAAVAGLLLTTIVAGLLVGLALLWWDPPALALFPQPEPTRVFTATSRRSLAPSDTSTPFPSPSVAPTPTDTPTVMPTMTALPTLTASTTLLPTQAPTLRSSPTVPAVPPTVAISLPSAQSSVHWIDVDLTHQVLSAYEGQTVVRTTPVSTGLPRTPTPTGQFRIYIKLRADDMSGPGYYLRNVPFTMYFYRGYGLHGTYWHSNFGHPMSHGCINLPTPEAKWLFGWAEVGTLVNIHQ